jgi:GAF domain
MTSNTTTAFVSARMELLCRNCVQAVSVDGGSISLVSSRGSRVALGATDRMAAELEEVQMSLGEGPYLDAVASLSPVQVHDFADPAAPGADRWPFLAKEVARRDVRALFGFPVSLGDVPVGTVGLYRRRPGPLSAAQLEDTLTAVDDIAASLLDQDTWTGVASRAPTEQEAPVRLGTGAPVVHQAAGMAMIQLDVGIDEAMALLRATAYAEGKALADLALEVVDRRRRLGEADNDE